MVLFEQIYNWVNFFKFFLTLFLGSFFSLEQLSKWDSMINGSEVQLSTAVPIQWDFCKITHIWPAKKQSESFSSLFNLHCIFILYFLMASCTLFLGTYYGLRSGKFLKLISKPITMTLLIIYLNYEKYYFYVFKKRKGCSSGFLTVILLLRKDVIILICTFLCKFLLQYLGTGYMKYSVML